MYRNQALALIRKRLETRHAAMPMSAKIAEKIGDILPLLKSFESPLLYVDPQSKAQKYRKTFALKERASETMINLMLESQKEVAALEKSGNKAAARELAGAANAVTGLLDGALVEARYYLEKNQEDA